MSNKPLFTPGEWVIDNSIKERPSIIAINSDIIGNIVCEAPNGWEESEKYWAANAKLIAAAPDTYKLLERLIDAGQDENKIAEVKSLWYVLEQKINP